MNSLEGGGHFLLLLLDDNQSIGWKHSFRKDNLCSIKTINKFKGEFNNRV
jgi:hypothetical protein